MSHRRLQFSTASSYLPRTGSEALALALPYNKSAVMTNIQLCEGSMREGEGHLEAPNDLLDYVSVRKEGKSDDIAQFFH